VQRIYLDANATAPLDPRVREAMIPWLDAGNASSPHAEGRAARAAIDEAREHVAAMIGAHHREIIFTSGATEADALALLGSLDGVVRIACSSVEHPAVLRTLEALDVDLVLGPVDELGRLDPSFRIPDGTGIASFMLANNETGAILPVRELADQAHACGAIMHTDAVQACGKMAVDVDALGVDLLCLSAHKMGGPKGAGALYVRRGTRLRPLAHGGEHERGLRPGTENVAAIVGLGVAARLAIEETDSRIARWRALSETLFGRLAAEFPDVRINSPREERVQNTVSITFPDVEGEAVLLGLDLEGVAVATGSACSSGATEPSHVLRAMGLSHEQAERSIRISMHAATTQTEIEFCLTTLARVVKNLRSLAV
jgi:cysteine desulfurase